MLPALKELKLASLSDVRCTFHLGDHPGKTYGKTVLVIRFTGTYRVGSAGNPDATFMMAMGNTGVEVSHPHAIVIDLSGLTYSWGDMLEGVLSIGRTPDRPSAVVVGKHCRVAVGTLLFGENSTKDICEQDGYFDLLEPAWRYVTSMLDESERPSIHEAASNGDLVAVENFLQAGDNANRHDSIQRTPLHCTSDPHLVSLLLKAGADPRAKDLYGLTPLHIVEKIDAARLLLKAGADPDARSVTGLSPLGHAQSPEIALLLIEYGADVNLRRRDSLLHFVRQPEIAKVLIESGADVNIVNENGDTPLDCAEESERRFRRQFQTFGQAVDAETAQRYLQVATIIRSAGGHNGSKAR